MQRSAQLIIFSMYDYKIDFIKHICKPTSKLANLFNLYVMVGLLLGGSVHINICAVLCCLTFKE